MDLGLARAGHTHRFFCEADPYRRRVLERHWPGVPVYSDVRALHVRLAGGRDERRELPGEEQGVDRRQAGDRASPQQGEDAGGLPAIDLLCGGFPCQDLSVAGRREGLRGGRSGLFFEFARIADELVRPGGWILVENVPGLLSACSCEGCCQCGELLRVHREGWRRVGMDGRRGDGGGQPSLFADDDLGEDEDRPGGGRCPCGRCDEARRHRAAHAGTDFAVVRSVLDSIGFHDLAWRVLDSRYFGVPQRRRRVFILGRRARGRRAAEVLLEPESGGGNLEAGSVSGPRLAASLSRGSASAGVSVPGRRQEDDENIVAHTLRSEGFDASEDGTGRGTPLTLAGSIGGHYGTGRRSEDDPNLVTDPDPPLRQGD
jgi:site-specific DNA-cytosine methylase